MPGTVCRKDASLRRIVVGGPEGLGVVGCDAPTTSIRVQFDPVALIAQDQSNHSLMGYSADDEIGLNEGQR
jgi:hypothetical protein